MLDSADFRVPSMRHRVGAEEWQARTRPAAAHGQDGLRRPMHLKRVCRPTDDAFKL